MGLYVATLWDAFTFMPYYYPLIASIFALKISSKYNYSKYFKKPSIHVGPACVSLITVSGTV